MSVSQLEELFQQCRWNQVVHLAEEMLSQTSDPGEIVEINAILSLSRWFLFDPLGALPPAERAVEVAWAHGLWDKWSKAMTRLATSYYNLRRYDELLDLINRFFSLRKQMPPEALRYEGQLWHTLGLTYRNGFHNPRKAQTALILAHRFSRLYNEVFIWERSRRDLIQTLLILEELDDVVKLLAEGEEYARARPDDALAQFDQSFDTCKYLRRVGKYTESIKSGLKALEHAKGHPIWEFCAYMEMRQTAIAATDFSYALGFALSARLSAIDGGRYDLEYEATAAMIELIRDHGPELVLALDRQYSEHGMDVFQFIPESVLHRDRRAGN